MLTSQNGRCLDFEADLGIVDLFSLQLAGDLVCEARGGEAAVAQRAVPNALSQFDTRPGGVPTTWARGCNISRRSRTGQRKPH